MANKLLKGLSIIQLNMVKECKSPTELLELARSQGFELTENQLEAISGGGYAKKYDNCPSCGSVNKYALETTLGDNPPIVLDRNYTYR